MKWRVILIVAIVILIMGGIFFAVIKHYNFLNINRPKPIDYSYRNQIRLEIINCSGIDKAGQRAQQFLRDLGFDVYAVQSGRRVLEHTVVIERLNPEMKNACEVAKALGKNKKLGFLPLNQKILPEIQKDLDSLLYLEVSVILGKDCPKFIPQEHP